MMLSKGHHFIGWGPRPVSSNWTTTQKLECRCLPESRSVGYNCGPANSDQPLRGNVPTEANFDRGLTKTWQAIYSTSPAKWPW